MPTRIDRKTDEGRELYYAHAPDIRAKFQGGLAGAVVSVKSADELSQAFRRWALEMLGMVVTEGYVGGNWTKVHTALSRWPELYAQVHDILPRGSDDAIAL